MNDYGWSYDNLKGYKSPIELIQTPFDDVMLKMREAEDNAIVAEVSRQLGVVVDKEELVKALNYDRQQYQQGYRDACMHYQRPTASWEFEVIGIMGSWHCSNCGHVIVGAEHQKPVANYCPHCGAEMCDASINSDEIED